MGNGFPLYLIILFGRWEVKNSKSTCYFEDLAPSVILLLSEWLLRFHMFLKDRKPIFMLVKFQSKLWYGKAKLIGQMLRIAT